MNFSSYKYSITNILIGSLYIPTPTSHKKNPASRVMAVTLGTPALIKYVKFDSSGAY